MKRILLTIALCLTYNGYTQNTINENFEGTVFPPTGWVINSTVAARPWTTAASGDFFIAGTKSAFINWIAQANDANLISPTFSLVGYSSADFKFSVKVGWSYMIDLNDGDLFAKVSNDGGLTWTQVWVEEDSPQFIDDGDGNPDTDLYNTVPVTINMSAYLGQSNLKIKFQYTANNADAVSIDDVIVQGTLSLDDFVSSKFSISPNPVKAMLAVSNTENISINAISIADLNGRVIKEVKYNNISNLQVDLSDLSSGMYIMNINSDQGIASKKIVKE
jgi:hypothetical protein